MKHIVNAATPRLSDEEVDPLEQEDVDGVNTTPSDGWLLWSADDILDIKKIIKERMPEKQRMIIDAFLLGQNNRDIGVTEKFWRYNYQQAIAFIKKELELR